MTECFDPRVRDFLPDLVHGRLGDVDAETLAAHVRACEACAREVALIREVRQTAPLVPSMNIDGIVAHLPVAAVVPAMAVEPSRAGVLGRGSVIWKVLAAVAIVVAGGVVANRTGAVPGGAGGPDPLAVSAPAAQVTTAPPTNGSSLSLVAGVKDLTDDQIEMLLAELDDVEAIPSLEPEQAVITVIGVDSAP